MSEKTGIAAVTAESFQPFVGKLLRFQRADGAAVELELLEVTTSSRKAGLQRQPFSLLFALKGENPLGQGLLTLHHDDFAADPWFITRVSVLGGDPAIAYCEAVFT